ncbi:MAG: transposase family protein, partial [Anaerolineae bacterium]
MEARIHPRSVLGRIMALVPDPRGRRGRRFPLVGILAMLLLGALEGEGSLRGMWLRGRKYWAVLVRELADLGLPIEPPALGTVWSLMQRIDAVALEEALRGE